MIMSTVRRYAFARLLLVVVAVNGERVPFLSGESRGFSFLRGSVSGERTTLLLKDLDRYGLQHRTEVAHGRLVAAVHQYALWLSGSEEKTAHDSVVAASHLLVLGQQLKMMSVLKARIVYKASWSQVATSMGVDEDTAVAVYGEPEARWRSGDLQPWLPRTEGIPSVRPRLRWLPGGRKPGG